MGVMEPEAQPPELMMNGAIEDEQSSVQAHAGKVNNNLKALAMFSCRS
jgi:hypothetical protein